MVALLCCVQVDDEWILRRLERWGRKDGMPFLGRCRAAARPVVLSSTSPSCTSGAKQVMIVALIPYFEACILSLPHIQPTLESYQSSLTAGPKKGAILAQLVAEKQPRVVVEVGTMAGRRVPGMVYRGAGSPLALS
jgi:hypothetical protein